MTGPERSDKKLVKVTEGHLKKKWSPEVLGWMSENHVHCGVN